MKKKTQEKMIQLLGDIYFQNLEVNQRIQDILEDLVKEQEEEKKEDKKKAQMTGQSMSSVIQGTPSDTSDGAGQAEASSGEISETGESVLSKGGMSVKERMIRDMVKRIKDVSSMKSEFFGGSGPMTEGEAPSRKEGILGKVWCGVCKKWHSKGTHD